MNSEQILSYIESKISEDTISNIISSNTLTGVTASEIESEFSIYRSNASMLLNQLNKENKLVKINSRPVYFIPTSVLGEYITDETIMQSYSPQGFIDAISPKNKINSAFEVLIGHQDSLATQIEKAKASLLYPPNGLHTLLVGESGTGKTVFARAMYNYGLLALHKEPSEFPFVEFNCSDYYNNPQLLMSHLFGHVKGAFTGADSNQEGLVEKANGGILFLDEIHRLPPEGQEMLFYLLDTGSYRKLGETKNMHKATVRIIGATTENPEDILLKTFQRRIPLTIEMPAYRDKSIEERVKINEFIFNREALATLKQYIVPQVIIEALASFPFPENIGQLSSEIKVLCARSLLGGPKNQDSLTVSYDLLSKPIRDYYESKSSEIMAKFPLRYESNSIRFPKGEDVTIDNSLYKGQTYTNLVTDIEHYLAKGYTKSEVQSTLSDEIQSYCNHIISDFYGKALHTEEMYKVIDKKIVDFTMKTASTAFNDIAIELSQKNILILAFHFKYLIERKRGKKDLTENDICTLKEEHSEELSIAKKMIDQLVSQFKIQVDSNENYLLALILTNMHETSSNDQIALIIMAHGKSTATSIASVCNELMDCSIVKAIDVPLNQNLEETHTNISQLIRRLEPTKGALLIVDMGSLIQLGNKVSEETGYNIKTVANLTTLQALNYTRLILNASDETTVEEILASSIDVAGLDTSIDTSETIPHNDEVNEKCILSICASGAGTSSAFKSVIERELLNNDIPDITVVALSAFDIQKNSPKYQAICSHYDILAYISNIDMKIEVPLFHVTDLISSSGKKDFINFINNLLITEEYEHQSKTAQDECLEFLNENVTCINPIISIQYSDKFIQSLDIPWLENDSDLHVSLLLHLAFMLERNVLQNKILFDDMDLFIKANQEFFDKIKENIHILNEPFDIDINDAEICYIIKSLSEAKK